MGVPPFGIPGISLDAMGMGKGPKGIMVGLDRSGGFYPP